MFLANNLSNGLDLCVGEGVERVRRRTAASDVLGNGLESVESHGCIVLVRRMLAERTSLESPLSYISKVAV